MEHFGLLLAEISPFSRHLISTAQLGHNLNVLIFPNLVTPDIGLSLAPLTFAETNKNWYHDPLCFSNQLA